MPRKRRRASDLPAVCPWGGERRRGEGERAPTSRATAFASNLWPTAELGARRAASASTEQGQRRRRPRRGSTGTDGHPWATGAEPASADSNAAKERTTRVVLGFPSWTRFDPELVVSWREKGLLTARLARKAPSPTPSTTGLTPKMCGVHLKRVGAAQKAHAKVLRGRLYSR